MSSSGLLANHQDATGRRCPATNALAENVFEPAPIAKPKRTRAAREDTLPTLGMPREFWDPDYKPMPPEPLVPTWQRRGFLSAQEWWASIEKQRAAYLPRLPRISIVSGGLPGLGRRR